MCTSFISPDTASSRAIWEPPTAPSKDKAISCSQTPPASRARLSGEKLAINLKGRGIRLAILGACEGGRRDEINPWTGVAPALTKASIPAVVGMQYTIRDANAIAFSRQFYRALAAGQPIDAAVTEGRLAIFNQADDE